MKFFRTGFAALLLALALCFAQVATVVAKEAVKIDKKRNQLIGYIIEKQLPMMHFSNKKVDDALVRDAFQLYIKQLDFQKRFLLQKDVEILQAFIPHLDDDLTRGTLTLPDTAFDILGERISQVEKMVGEILSKPIVATVPETLESDPEKLSYATTQAELHERWRKILKGQVISRFLELEDDQKNEPKKKESTALWQEAVQKVTKQNKNFFHRLHQETLQDHYDRFFNAVTRAFDPHTNYIPPAGKEQFDISMSGSLEGIGALLREDDGFIKVTRIIPGSASARQGRLQAEDIILRVAEGADEPVDVSDMRLGDAVRLIRGPKGSEVRLTVRKADGSKDIIPIIRDVVQIEETFVKSMVLEHASGKRFGYLLIPSFYRDFRKNGGDGRNSSDDTRQEIEKLKKENVDGIILDLRNNGGGALVDAVEITGLFIDRGPVVQVKNESGAERLLSDDDPGEVYDGPLLVLINRFSASASEIVAGALQDYGRAVVVGDDHTHGKGTVQTVVDLNESLSIFSALRKTEDLGALKVTIQKFYRVTGNSTQYKGVEPDIVLPSMLQHIKSGERYLEYSLPWDAIGSARYQNWPRKIDVAQLRQNSQQRVNQDQGLQAIAEEAKRAEQRGAETLLSLTIKDMRAEKEKARLAREKVGEHFRQFRAQDTGDDDTAPPPEESRDEWMKNVREEPYVRESLNILIDMMAVPTAR